MEISHLERLFVFDELIPGQRDKYIKQINAQSRPNETIIHKHQNRPPVCVRWTDATTNTNQASHGSSWTMMITRINDLPTFVVVVVVQLCSARGHSGGKKWTTSYKQLVVWFMNTFLVGIEQEISSSKLVLRSNLTLRAKGKFVIFFNKLRFLENSQFFLQTELTKCFQYKNEATVKLWAWLV